MNIAVGCDHAGFILKDTVINHLKARGHNVLDMGTNSTAAVDYPDFAAAVARAVQSGKADRGIIMCGSGVGASIAANKFKGVRAGLCHDTYSAGQGVEHDHMNVLCLGARIVGSALAGSLLDSFLNASYTTEERHLRRLAKVAAIEKEQMK